MIIDELFYWILVKSIDDVILELDWNNSTYFISLCYSTASRRIQMDFIYKLINLMFLIISRYVIKGYTFLWNIKLTLEF